MTGTECNPSTDAQITLDTDCREVVTDDAVNLSMWARFVTNSGKTQANKNMPHQSDETDCLCKRKLEKTSNA